MRHQHCCRSTKILATHLHHTTKHTAQHTLQHTLRHTLRHTRRHALQHALQYMRPADCSVFHSCPTFFVSFFHRHCMEPTRPMSLHTCRTRPSQHAVQNSWDATHIAERLSYCITHCKTYCNLFSATHAATRTATHTASATHPSTHITSLHRTRHIPRIRVLGGYD